MFGVGRLVANFPAGVLSQKFGRRPMLFIGPLIVAGSSAAAAMTGDFYFLLFWRFVQGVGSGIYMTASLAAIADISPPAHRAGNVALYQASQLLGASVGPALGGLVTQWFGYSAPFWCMTVVGVLASLTAVSSFEDSIDTGAARKPLPSSVARRGMMTMSFTGVCALTCAVFFTRVVAMYQLVPQLGAESLGLGVGSIGAALTFWALMNFAVLPISPRLIEQFGARSVIAGASALTVLGLILLWAATNAAMFWFSIVVLGVGGGLSYPAIGAFAIGCLPRERYGAGMGVQRTFGDIGFVFGPVIAGALDDLTGGHTADILANIGLITAATIFFLVASVGWRRDAR